MAEAMHYGKTSFPVTLAPEEIAAELEPNAVELEQKTVPELVRDALAHPIDSKPLKELVKPGESVCIIISDVTRRWQSPETYIPIVVEELGFVGGLVVLVLFALLILRGYWLALNARDKFGALTIVGIITLLAVQVFLNIGVVTNLIPTTGISLPFFSYGGTALMIQLAEMGIILSVSRQIPAPRQE